MPLGGMGRTIASALPTATCGYVGDPKGGGIPTGTEPRGAKLAHEIASTGHQKDNPAANMPQKGKSRYDEERTMGKKELLNEC